MIRYAVHALAVRRFVAFIEADNRASRGVARNAGCVEPLLVKLQYAVQQFPDVCYHGEGVTAMVPQRVLCNLGNAA